MNKKKQKSEIRPAQLKRMFKQHKIRESRVDLVRLNIGRICFFHIFCSNFIE